MWEVYIVIDVEEFLEMYKRAQQLPTEKLQYPMTEAQEIGWDTTPLVSYHVCSEVLHSNSTRTLWWSIFEVTISVMQNLLWGAKVPLHQEFIEESILLSCTPVEGRIIKLWCNTSEFSHLYLYN